MSFDDDFLDPETQVPNLCDDCTKEMEATEPHPVTGWRLLVFKCVKCQKVYCPHLYGRESEGLCVECVSPYPKSIQSGDEKK